MRIEKVETGELTATLTLELSPEDYTPGLEKALKEQRRNATWPGFRPGCSSLRCSTPTRFSLT